ncbi:hypothetical protein [[Flexibacter] sp. ATCC 35208]|uniref:hypothetical protein n=1 Tax=[Flexibacter] sp. ATCC 35208 TaxID=1936242 RepID=UPI0009C4F7B3|nr:hypothetical protein [[Flexibacter] sp. ATCC 35208]OMP79154.1 hypothetical protein BW716_11085 [[Flexibacter] sp. ATCC 35208]
MKRYQHTLLLLILCVICSIKTAAQTTPNPEQKQIANQFLALLERHKIEEAALLLTKPDKKQMDAINKAVKEMDSIPMGTKLLIMQVNPEKGVIYRSSYIMVNENYKSYYQADVMFEKSIDRKIAKVKFFNRKYLEEDEKKRMARVGETPPEAPAVKVKH